MYDVAIVGGGMAGMATAARLQARGLSTVVLEAHTLPGGCAGFYRRNGFTFDVGATTLVDFQTDGVGERFLASIGIESLDADMLSGYVAWLPDRCVVLHKDPALWHRERLAMLGDGAWAIYTVKLLATLTVTLLLTVIFTALTYAAIYIGSDVPMQDVFARLLKTALIHGLAVIAYCCLFGLLSIITKRILVVGILYIAIFEGLFANLPFGIRLITVIYYARLIAYHTLAFTVMNPSGTEDLATDAWQLDLKSIPGF